MPYYRSVGSVPPKRHVQHRDADGTLYYEELMGEEGFSSDSSLLYHRHVPAAVTDVQPWHLPDHTTTANHPLRPRHLRLRQLTDAGAAGTGVPDSEAPGGGLPGVDAVTGRRLLLGNDDVRICYVAAAAPSPLYRNATGDECVYVEAGSGVVRTVFGELPVRRGDYVLLPRATTHCWLPRGVEPLRLYCIESNSHIRSVCRYLSRHGQFLEQAPYCERDLHGPAGLHSETGRDVEVLVKHRTRAGVTGSRVTCAEHPFDVVGWDGCLYPYTFNVDDFEPVTGRVHLPPPVHQVFEGDGFVVCNFVPRKVDYHPLAIPVPYYHSNVDSDEVMFYCGGDYEARRGSGIAQGSVSVHPGGIPHGPQPGAYQGSAGVQFFDELAVMVDTFRPLELGEGALACEDPDYVWSWARARRSG